MPMPTRLVLTAIGLERPGLVSLLSDAVASAGGNWLDARMASLAGQFAGILLVEVASDRAADLEAALQALESHGLQLVIAHSAGEQPAAGGRVLRLEVLGHDRPGIVRDISRVLAGLRVSIADLETERSSGSFSGEALFKARALLQLPDGLGDDSVRQALEALANEWMVDLSVVPGSAG